ncbi:MAG: NAD(P)H-hydrate dehydratase [Prevotellaceae bacterium]|jgi:NAD(P)H-hydrate epimerase|nr:NAD(P)H-hydrate dehydratase [Prevotellaceae bacterium]
MKILTGNQIREADEYTVRREPVSSLDLMERAAVALADGIERFAARDKHLLVVVGRGNNGGDGLAVARILSERGYECSVRYVFEESRSPEFAANKSRLPPAIVAGSEMRDNTVIIDAIFGTGIKDAVGEPAASAIKAINTSGKRVISLDLPSGMKTEFGNSNGVMVKADVTLAIEFPKLAALLPEAGEFAGELHVVPIGLDKEFIAGAESRYHYLDAKLAAALTKPRLKFGHKNMYGHALLVCGSRNMTGAAVLAAGGALRSGCGLVTAYVPGDARFALQTVCPSAMIETDAGEFFSHRPANLAKYDAIGAGCGLGTEPETAAALADLLEQSRKMSVPMVIDADAINILAAHRELLKLVAPGSVLTPHTGEMKRLAGEFADEKDKLDRVSELASEFKSTIVLKGAHTAVFLPDGKIFFNSVDSPGMAKGGSGDVLTGLVAGLLARYGNGGAAALLGVFFHGAAGRRAARLHGVESMNSADIMHNINCNAEASEP